MARFRAGPCSIGVGVALLVSATLVGTGQQPGLADVTAVQGDAYGYFSQIGLFGGPANPRPCANPPTNTIDCRPRPRVTLPAGGSALLTDSVPTADARYGPGIFFTSGPITVTTEGTTGPTGSVTSTANITQTNTSGVEVLTAANLSSTCTANEDGAAGSTTITNGTLQTSDGDPNVDGDETVIVLPTTPTINQTYEGVLNSVGDSFTAVFNEQTQNPDGSITVIAYHQIANGPTAVGELIVGRVVCGVTATGAPTTTTDPSATTTTTDPSATTSTTNPSATTTTTNPAATTTTTNPATTTTTRAGGGGVLGSSNGSGTSSTPAAGGILARTGGKTGWKLGLGIGLFTIGMSATLLGRRRRGAPGA